MKLTCPSCGAINSAEAWSNDAIARQCLKIVGELPYDVSKRCLAYLAMFRADTGKGLGWSKALRLLDELQKEITAPYVQWKTKVARPNTPAAWGTAMERIIECPPKTMPLKSHGYLKSIAYELADEIDKRVEYGGNAVRANAECRPAMERPERIGASFEELRKIRRQNMGDRKPA